MSTPVQPSSTLAAGATRAPAGEAAESAAEQPWPSPAKSWYAVGIFAVALMLDFLDRGVIALLVQPIKHDLNLSDTQMGLLMGTAFIIFYLLLGLPIARLADSRSRRAIIGWGIAIWSVATAACGLARSFWPFFGTRIGVGVGEACNGPATFSMMADMFPKEKLARAIATLNFGFVIGNGIATIIGGAVILFVSGHGDFHFPALGTVHPWQVTFFAVGLPGLIVAALLSTVIEPPRRGRMRAASPAQARSKKAIPVREVVRFLAANKTTYGPMFLGLACSNIVAFGIQAWAPTFFVRTYGWTIPHYAFVVGVLMLVLFPIALIPGSMVAEWLTRKGYDDANLRLTLFTLVADVPFYIAFALMPTPALSLACLGMTFLIASFSIGAQNAALQIITPNEMRAQITALFLFIFNTFGTGIAPLVVGLVTNHVIGSEARVGESIALTAAVFGPLAVLITWSGLKPYGRSVARARAWD
ncbi:MAG: MFS transporter [Steroidobacteraceae bacterium]